MVIPDLLITPLQQIDNPKGKVLHVLKSGTTGFVGINEVYCSEVAQNAIKGWKKHLRIQLNLTVIVGQVQFFFVDDRRSAASPLTQQIVCGPSINYCRITVPPNIWVAFKGIGSTNTIINCISELHDPSEQLNIPLDSYPLLSS